ncbi:hypothetical protein QCA50_006911 [Cerrena zonata]|uniref:mRNA-capping enzyme subunit beta n=1 Tax=Cerrena zonata TaxID=2478898 RepID=A0AAW0GL04_9APHY
MDNHEYPSDSENDIHRPYKRARRTPSPSRSNGHPSRSSLPPLSLSILGVEPFDEFIIEIADFIHHMIKTRPDGPGRVEVEAKVGVLREKGSGQRLSLPVLVETILEPDSFEYRFESNMSAMQHKHFNQLLNNLKTNQPGHAGSPLQYAHLRLVDTFYPSDNRDKVRVTRDETTSEVKECMKKIRLGSLDIYCPKRNADWRISVNLEVPVPPPIGSSTHTRRKDRMSYTHEEFVIDLTQVTASSGGNAKTEILHELELELARPDYVLYAASKRDDPAADELEQSAFNELIRAFVNNARILVKNATGNWQ